MKTASFMIGLLSTSLLTFISTTDNALAQCIQSDVSVQYNISGSRQPTDRRNDVQFDSSPNCQGNTSVTTGVQGNVGGTGRVRQHRTVRHNQRGGSNHRGFTGGPNLQIQVNPAIDVYNPADRLR